MSEVKLYAYIPDTACAKCGGADISDRFHRAASSEFGNGPDCAYGEVCNFVRVEHIRRYCRRCSHEWACAPIDMARPKRELCESRD